jgi:hypothetical protein
MHILIAIFLFLQTTRAPNPFEISPRPFTVTTSPLQSRGQFSSFGQTSGRQNGGFQFENPYNFPPSAQQQQPSRLNPYLDSTGFGEVKENFQHLGSQINLTWIFATFSPISLKMHQ